MSVYVIDDKFTNSVKEELWSRRSKLRGISENFLSSPHITFREPLQIFSRHHTGWRLIFSFALTPINLIPSKPFAYRFFLLVR